MKKEFIANKYISKTVMHRDLQYRSNRQYRYRIRTPTNRSWYLFEINIIGCLLSHRVKRWGCFCVSTLTILNDIITPLNYLVL